MGYTKDDELAINTIRLLAVILPHHELAFSHSTTKLTTDSLD